MNLRSARLVAGLSQEEAAQALGVTVQAWSGWERGITTIPMRAWKLLGATPDAVGPTRKPNAALSAARLQRGLSIADSARALDVHPNAWSNWESGRAPAPIEAYELVGLPASEGVRKLGERSARTDGPRKRAAYYDQISTDRENRVARAMALRDHGLRDDEIADKMGVHLVTIRSYFRGA